MIDKEAPATTRDEVIVRMQKHHDNPHESTQIMDCWMLLVDAICVSGIHDNDEAFLNSRWYEYLKDMLIDYNSYRS